MQTITEYPEVFTKQDNNHFKDLTMSEQEKSLTWIRANVFPRKTVLNGHTSYGMKHILQDRTGIYMSNNQFKEAMLICGFEPFDEKELNWRYCLSNKSPIFTVQDDMRYGLLIPKCVENAFDVYEPDKDEDEASDEEA